MKIYAVLDKFHPWINGESNPEVRSDNPAFEDVDEFLNWCKQHGALEYVYEITPVSEE